MIRKFIERKFLKRGPPSTPLHDAPRAIRETPSTVTAMFSPNYYGRLQNLPGIGTEYGYERNRALDQLQNMSLDAAQFGSSATYINQLLKAEKDDHLRQMRKTLEHLRREVKK